MRKRLLDLNPAKTVEWIHKYIRFELEFGDFYGNNLDALYDALTSITEDTCIGVFCQPKDDSKLSVYLEKVKSDKRCRTGQYASLRDIWRYGRKL